MASIISAGTTSATALNMSADTTGILQLASNNGTVAVTVDASQNVGIGAASPGTRLQIGNPSDANQALRFDFADSSTARINSTRLSSGNLQSLQLAGQDTMQFVTNGTERMRIDSAGRLLVNRTSTGGSIFDTCNLQVTGNLSVSRSDPEFILQNTGSAAKIWRILGSSGGGATAAFRIYDGSSDADRLWINTSGLVLVGATGNANNTEIFGIQNAGGGSVVMRLQRGGNNPAYIGTDSSNPFQVWDSGVNQRFVVTSGGSCQNTTGSYGSFSDEKLKENIIDATPKLDDIMKLKVRNYGLKKEPNSKFIGFIAQELQEVFPSMIETFEDEDENGEKTGEVTLGVKTTVLVPMLVKAIQELNAKVTALEEQVLNLGVK
jgi:hypothetical protein